MRTNKPGPAAKLPDGKQIKRRLYATGYNFLVSLVGPKLAPIVVIGVSALLSIGLYIAAVSSTTTLDIAFLKSVGHFLKAEYYKWGPIERAEAGTFTVGVAQLGDDSDDSIKHLILADLQEIKWIGVLNTHRTVPLNDTGRQSIADGHATALKLLKESGAQILVWGRVLGDGSNKVPELFISAAPDPATGLKQGRYPFDELFNLPRIFWQQLASVLDLVVVNQSVRLLDNKNPDMADALPPFIAKVKQLLLDSQGESNWDKKTRADVQNALAVALWAQADVSDTAAPLAEGCDIFEDTVKTYDPQTDWKQLAAAKQTLGMARLALFRRETRLGARVPTAEQQALLKRALEDSNGAALILFQHGQGTDPTALFDIGGVLSADAGFSAQQKAWHSVDEAVGAYRESAGMSPQERGTNGRLWVLFTLAQAGVAMAHGDVVLNDFAVKLGRVKILQNTEGIYRYLLLIWTMEKYPSLSITIRSALVDALLLSGAYESGQEASASLNEAAKQSRQVIHDKEMLGDTPTLLDRAELAAALAGLGTRDSGAGGTDQLRQAVRIYGDALYPYVSVGASADWFEIQASMAVSLQLLAEREQNPLMLCQAFTRSIASEKGLAADGASYEEVIQARGQADASIRSLRTMFGDQTAHECEVAEKQFLNAFGPH